jgi:metallo-beta-lactamase family protein
LQGALVSRHACLMHVQFIGATRTTTGSMYLIQVNGQKILLECGLYQGRRDETIERNRTFPFDPSEIDAAVLSHAHIDHCGNFPNLCRQGFQGNIYCTFATRDLAAIMLADSAHIQQYDAEYVSRKRAKKGQGPVEPLYTAKDAEQAVSQFVAINYDRSMMIAKGVKVTFKDAGHILGSAQVVLDVEENGRRFRYLFSGDVGRGGHEILRDPQAVDGVDFLQIESTYGGRDHSDRVHAKEEVGKLVNDTLNQKGKVIIPAFSVGRTQLIVYTLHQLTLNGTIPKIPIFVDSPLSVNATEVFRLHPECYNEKIYRFLHDEANPFGMENLTYIRHVEHSKKLNELREPAIIISASGMCEAGRIRHHLKNNIGNARNLVLFVGYCAQNTLGSKICNNMNPVNIFGEPVEVRAKVARVDAFSGHADRQELIQYVKNLTGRLAKVTVVHGEEEQSLQFSQTLKEILPGASVTVPERLETIEF